MTKKQGRAAECGKNLRVSVDAGQKSKYYVKERGTVCACAQRLYFGKRKERRHESSQVPALRRRIFPQLSQMPVLRGGDHPRKIKYNSSKQSGGRRVSDKKQTQSVRGAMAAVLVVVLLLLSWSLFGDKIVAKITPADDGNTPGVQDDVNTPDDSNTNTDDPNANNGDTTDPNTGDEPNANDPANGSDTTATNPGTTTTPSTPTVDASALSIKTNVGTTLPKDGNGNFDCTIKSSETIRLSVSGTDAAATWAVADASVLSISADGLITPAKVGTTTVTATVGGAVLTITVRIK